MVGEAGADGEDCGTGEDEACEVDGGACVPGTVLALRLGMLTLHHHQPPATITTAITRMTGHTFELA
ncbi:hypothetical protein BRAO375_1590022 [Bradyrhizobium sp. ORS 375]|nr:hypothetical protein BRAO375_1590022 [Bradyrhizobium sp. ORS 375]